MTKLSAFVRVGVSLPLAGLATSRARPESLPDIRPPIWLKSRSGRISVKALDRNDDHFPPPLLLHPRLPITSTICLHCSCPFNMYERVVVAGLLPVSAALSTPSEAQDPSLQPPLPFIAADLDVVIASVHLSAQQPLSHTLALATYVPKPRYAYLRARPLHDAPKRCSLLHTSITTGRNPSSKAALRSVCHHSSSPTPTPSSHGSSRRRSEPL